MKVLKSFITKISWMKIFPIFFLSFSPWIFHPAQSQQIQKKLFVGCHKRDQRFLTDETRTILMTHQFYKSFPRNFKLENFSHINLNQENEREAQHYPWQWKFSDSLDGTSCVCVRAGSGKRRFFLSNRHIRPEIFSFQREKKKILNLFFIFALIRNYN